MIMKKVFLLMFLLAFVLLLSACLPTQQEAMPEDQPGQLNTNNDNEKPVTYVDVSPVQAKNLIETKSDLIIIDVSPHYDNGHLPGALNYYLGDGSLDRAIPNLDKNKPYLVYCHVDSVAIAGAEKLIAAGITEVYRLEGNYAAWVDAGYEIER